MKDAGSASTSRRSGCGRRRRLSRRIPPDSRPAVLWLGLLLPLAALLRLVPVWFGLPYFRARPDEEVAVGIAATLLGGDLNPHFFHWPSFTFYLFAAAFWLARTGSRLLSAGDPPPAVYLVIARVIVACAGTATVFVLFRLGRRVGGVTTGLVAAAVLAVSLLHVRDSHFAMTDILAAFFVTASLAMLIRAMDEPAEPSALRWFAAAGAAGGLAASTKYHAAAVAAAMAAAQALIVVDSWRRGLRARAWLPSVAFALPLVAAFFAATPYALLDGRKFSEDVLFDLTHLSGGHGIDLGLGWVYHVTHSLPFGLGPAAFAAAVLGVIPLWRRSPRYAFALTSFFVALYLVIGSGRTVFFRYMLPLVPVACLFAAAGVEQAVSWLTTRMRWARRTASALVLTIVIGAGLINSVWLDVLLARTDTRVIAGQWLVERLAPAHTLYDAGGEYARLDLAAARFHQWYEFDPATRSFGHPEIDAPNWLVLYESPLFTHTQAPMELKVLASTRYTLVKTVRGTREGARGVYDLQDAFFMPVWGFWTVMRPGPTVHIYARQLR